MGSANPSSPEIVHSGGWLPNCVLFQEEDKKNLPNFYFPSPWRIFVCSLETLDFPREDLLLLTIKSISGWNEKVTPRKAVAPRRDYDKVN